MILLCARGTLLAHHHLRLHTMSRLDPNPRLPIITSIFSFYSTGHLYILRIPLSSHAYCMPEPDIGRPPYRVLAFVGRRYPCIS